MQFVRIEFDGKKPIEFDSRTILLPKNRQRLRQIVDALEQLEGPGEFRSNMNQDEWEDLHARMGLVAYPNRYGDCGPNETPVERFHLYSSIGVCL